MADLFPTVIVEQILVTDTPQHIDKLAPMHLMSCLQLNTRFRMVPFFPVTNQKLTVANNLDEKIAEALTTQARHVQRLAQGAITGQGKVLYGPQLP